MEILDGPGLHDVESRIFLAARVKDDIHECRWFGTYIDEDHVRFSFIYDLVSPVAMGDTACV